MNHFQTSGIVVRNVIRADPALVERLGRSGSATVHEAQRRTGLLQPYMRPVWPGASVCGTAVTVLAQPGDNWMLHVAAEVIKPGDVVVVGVTTQNDDGMFGDLLATSYRARGARGLVIDAGARDARTLGEMKFPVWSRAGRELLFRASDGRIMVAEYAVKWDTFYTEKPRHWPDLQIPVPKAGGTVPPNFSLSPDGKRLVVSMPQSLENAKGFLHVTFLLNYFDELRRRLPVK